jgi:acyl-CoA synthetase (AMP-forming)/AMP-acid ligase II
MREHEIGPSEDASEDFVTIREAIASMAETRCDAGLLISPETGHDLTFACLKRQVRKISAKLLAIALKGGDKVAFLTDNRLLTPQLFLGRMRAGLVTTSLDVRAGVAQLAYSGDDCAPLRRD